MAFAPPILKGGDQPVHRSSRLAITFVITAISLMPWAGTRSAIASQNEDIELHRSTGDMLSLKEAIDLALAASPAVVNAKDALDIARSNLALVSRDVLINPTVKVSARADAFWSNGTDSRTDSREITMTIQDSLPTGKYLTGPSEAEKLAMLRIRDAERNLALSKEEVIYKTMSTYIGFLKAQKSLALAQKSLDLSEILFQDARTKLNLGIASTSDLLKAQQTLDEARDNVTKARASLEIASLQFNQLTGLPLDASVSLSEEFDYSPSSYDIGQLLESALENRLEMQKAKDNLMEATINLDEILKSRKPTITVSGGYAGKELSFDLSTSNPTWDLNWQISGQYNMGQYNAGLPGEQKRDDGWHVGISLSWTPFDGGVSLEKEKEARIQVAQATRQVRDQESQIVLSIHQAYNDFIAAQGAVQNAESAVKLAQESLRIIQLRRDKGYATDRDVSQAELALQQAITNRDFAVYDYMLAEARLKRAAGKSLGE